MRRRHKPHPTRLLDIIAIVPLAFARPARRPRRMGMALDKVAFAAAAVMAADDVLTAIEVCQARAQAPSYLLCHAHLT